MLVGEVDGVEWRGLIVDPECDKAGFGDEHVSGSGIGHHLRRFTHTVLGAPRDLVGPIDDLEGTIGRAMDATERIGVGDPRIIVRAYEDTRIHQGNHWW